MNIRIGHGYDVHRFDQDSDSSKPHVLKLGGIDVVHHQAILAHSDGDVIIHALCDAMLGAIGAGDIGRHFPDSDPQYKNIDSTELLAKVVILASESGWKTINADITVVAQTPKLAPYIQTMRDKLAAQLQLDSTCLNVKATTTENLGAIGRQEGIAAYAVILLGRG